MIDSFIGLTADHHSSDRIDISCSRCNKITNLKVVTARYYIKRASRTYTCHQCKTKENAGHIAEKLVENALKKGFNNKTIISVECDRCKELFEVIKKNIVANKRRNGGEYRCKSCSQKLAHASGKFDKVYDDDFKIKLKESSEKFWAETRGKWRDMIVTDDFKKKMSESGKKAWTDEYRERISKLRATPEYKKKLSEWSKTAWVDDEFRIRFSNRMKELWKDQKFRKHIVEISKVNSIELWRDNKYSDKTIKAIKENWDDPVFVERFVNIIKNLWLDPVFYEKMVRENKERWLNPIFREKMSKLSNDRWRDPIYREKMFTIFRNRPNISSQQVILYSLLDDLHISYEKEFPIGIESNFDCVIFPHDSLKIKSPLVIEVQGDWYHSLPKKITRDKQKATYLSRYFPDYDLKYLWEHEFNNKDRVVNLLRYWLGLAVPDRVVFDLRDVKVLVIDFKVAELFISKYHYAGRVGRSGFNIGFYIGEVLVAVCVFANPVRQEVAIKQGFRYKEVFELTRFAIHPGYQLKNFASFCIGWAIRLVRRDRPEIKCLVSFADSTFNHDGVIYRACNWRLDGEVAPDYWYIDENNYVCHKKTLWNKASQMKLTEGAYCIRFNYKKVWGGKKLRYIYLLY